MGIKIRPRRTIHCAMCGKEVPFSSAYPTNRTKHKPKPSLLERRKYCIGCWNTVCSIKYNIKQENQRTVWVVMYKNGGERDKVLAVSESEAKSKARYLKSQEGITHVEIEHEIMENIKI